MTIEHDEAVRLAEKHGGVWGQGPSNLHIFDQSQLAALIAEVRRDEREKCAAICAAVGDGKPNSPMSGGAYLCAQAIRAKLEK